MDCDEKKAVSRHGAPTESRLLEKLSKLKGRIAGADDNNVAQLCLSGMLAILLSGTLFIYKSTNRVRHKVLGDVLDHASVYSETWGVGVIACLYQKLGMSYRREVAGLGGCTILLQLLFVLIYLMSIYIYFLKACSN